MKSIKYLLTFAIGFLFMISVKANNINKIDMDVYIDNSGNAHITETWDATLSQGTEGYRTFSGLEDKKISNFTVTDDSGKTYETIGTWNTSASFNNKAYKCGYNYTYSGVELCFGISKYGHRKYTLKYDISNFVTQYTDTQGIYFDFINFDFSVDDVVIKIHSDIPFSLDNSRIWGFGYEGRDVFEDGNIMMYSDGTLYSSDYMTILVRFESNIFNTQGKSDRSFDEIHDEAFSDIPEDEIPDEYKTDDDSFSFSSIKDFFTPYLNILKDKNTPIWTKALTLVLIPIIFVLAIVAILLLFVFASPFAIFLGFVILILWMTNRSSVISKSKSYRGNKRVNEKDVMYYREIPCNKDLEYAYFICKTYNLVSTVSLQKGLMGAVILKWIKEKKINVTPTKKGLFSIKDNNYALDLSSMTGADNDFEDELFRMMKSAAGFNKSLEPKEFEKWSKNNYHKIDAWYSSIENKIERNLINQGLITEGTEKQKGVLGINVTNRIKTLSDKLHEEAEHLVGFKKFLLDFSIMPEREYKEVAVWEEYLIFASLLGIADKVSEQFSKVYPNFRKETSFDVDMSNMVALHFVSDSFRGYDRGVKEAAERARDYSGGSDWGGGGGSSFSGGGSSSGGSSGGGFR